MKTIAQYALGILFVILITELVLIGPVEIKEKKTTSSPQKFEPGVEQASQVMGGIHVIETKNEDKEWELWAERAIGLKEHGDMSLEKVRASFFSEGGVSFDVVGNSGKVISSTKDMSMDGDVVTKSSNGYVFKTASLTYNSDSRILGSSTHVLVSGPGDRAGRGLTIEGQEMAADLNKGLVAIERNVKAKKRIQNNQNLEVESEKVQLSGHDRGVRFSGNVAIDIRGLKIYGPDALFKYNSKTDLLESIDLEGGVRVSDATKQATSEKLSIDLVKNEFVFDGQPRVVQNNDELRGDRIIFLDGGKRVKVQKAKINVNRENLGIKK